MRLSSHGAQGAPSPAIAIKQDKVTTTITQFIHHHSHASPPAITIKQVSVTVLVQ